METIPQLSGLVPRIVPWLLTMIGLCYVAATVTSLLHFLANNFVLRGTNLRKYGGKGTWAVVTGASDGIGKEFATQLAAKHFNLVLVSRTKSKLETLAKDLEQQNTGSGLQTKILAMDFAKDDDADYERLRELLSGLDVGLLINNVGQSHSIPVPFLETERSELQGIITVNCLGTLKTTQIVAPLMVQRKKGLIVTIGSFGGWTPTPYLATYSGSKAFLQYWSSSLAAELKPQGVDVQFVVSYLVTTALSKIRRTSLMIPNPKQFVRSTLGKVGLDNTQRIAYTYTPYWTHALFQRLIDSTVGFGSKFTIGVNQGMHLGIRNRALRKAARGAKRE